MKILADTDCAELFFAVKADDTIAFRQLYQRYWKALFISACKRVDADTAQDMVQEVMLSLWKRRSKVKITCSDDLQRYLHTALRYRVISYYAYESALIPIPDWFDVGFDAQVESAYDAKQLKDVINSEINLMPERMQTIFTLSRQHDLSIADIAAKLNLSEQTVKNQLTMAMKRLRASLSKYEQSDIAILSVMIAAIFAA